MNEDMMNFCVGPYITDKYSYFGTIQEDNLTKFLLFLSSEAKAWAGKLLFD